MKELIAVTGPTASGKTALAVRIARQTDGEIISADSRQVYRRMDIGTGKDLDEYGDIPYHLIDICEPGTKYNLHRFLKDFHTALSDIRSRGKQPILCGGTGLYLENALSGVRLPDVPENTELRKRLEPLSLPELTEILSGYKTLHNTTDVDSCKRAIRAIEIEEFYRLHPEAASSASRAEAQPVPHSLYLIDISRELRRQRISERLEARLKAGMTDEIKGLLEEGIPAEDLIYYGLEYKYVTLYLTGALSYEEMKSRLEIEIHKFAKRQMTWFRGMERRGFTFSKVKFEEIGDFTI
ncbi:MAG: tRNA (adenosine(37)-N6)-dimethylallyltransferase MiaA [Muribaculaceae bacterium]|nr:tRNA (adenosine(37)-N6)-dimethylallyltransferase MiaA [Muribaculaceae bacterium]